jgi:hypothetical protein
VWRRTLALLMAAIMVAACNSSGSNPLVTTSGASDTTAVGSSTTATTGAGETTTPTSAASTTSTAPPPVVPVPLREGLASFDAYVFTFSVITSGPTADARTESTNRIEYDRASNSRLVVSDTTQTGPDFEEPQVTSEKIRTVGNITCSFDGTDWSYTEVSDQEREISQFAERLIDFVPVIEDPIEVGRGEMAGIPAIHYTFTPSGLGQTSGAITEVSTAEYWVSVDGAILLSYHVVASSRNGPTGDSNTETFTLEMKADLVDTIGPGEVSLPQKCLNQAP